MSSIASENKKYLNCIREIKQLYEIENEYEIDIELKIDEIISKYLKKNSKFFLNLNFEILNNFFIGNFEKF
jgi:hypothetical protein